MTVAIEGLGGDRALRTLIVGRMEKLAGRVQNGPLAVRVAFTDENGPKGGRDTRCAITLDLPRRPPLHAEEVAETQLLVPMRSRPRRPREAIETPCTAVR